MTQMIIGKKRVQPGLVAKRGKRHPTPSPIGGPTKKGRIMAESITARLNAYVGALLSRKVHLKLMSRSHPQDRFHVYRLEVQKNTSLSLICLKWIGEIRPGPAQS